MLIKIWLLELTYVVPHLRYQDSGERIYDVVNFFFLAEPKYCNICWTRCVSWIPFRHVVVTVNISGLLSLNAVDSPGAFSESFISRKFNLRIYFYFLFFWGWFFYQKLKKKVLLDNFYFMGFVSPSICSNFTLKFVISRMSSFHFWWLSVVRRVHLEPGTNEGWLSRIKLNKN